MLITASLASEENFGADADFVSLGACNAAMPRITTRYSSYISVRYLFHTSVYENRRRHVKVSYYFI